eukprot:jgi/Mesvir1/29441/Mv26068-RA.1
MVAENLLLTEYEAIVYRISLVRTALSSGKIIFTKKLAKRCCIGCERGQARSWRSFCSPSDQTRASLR